MQSLCKHPCSVPIHQVIKEMVSWAIAHRQVTIQRVRDSVPPMHRSLNVNEEYGYYFIRPIVS